MPCRQESQTSRLENLIRQILWHSRALKGNKTSATSMKCSGQHGGYIPTAGSPAIVTSLVYQAPAIQAYDRDHRDLDRTNHKITSSSSATLTRANAGPRLIKGQQLANQVRNYQTLAGKPESCCDQESYYESDIVWTDGNCITLRVRW